MAPYTEKASQWLTDTFDKSTQEEVQQLIDANSNELTESFIKI